MRTEQTNGATLIGKELYEKFESYLRDEVNKIFKVLFFFDAHELLFFFLFFLKFFFSFHTEIRRLQK